MASDPTETTRRELVSIINAHPKSRDQLEAMHGQVWDTEQLKVDFQVTGFLAPFVTVVRKADQKPGLLCFQHLPRFYFHFEELS